jgi:hypothetical protein
LAITGRILLPDRFRRIFAEQFLQRKSQFPPSGAHSCRYAMNENKRRFIEMEYIILAAVLSMMALYALIIRGCLKQPEW